MHLSEQARANYGILRDTVSDPLLQRLPAFADDNVKHRGKARKKDQNQTLNSQCQDGIVDSDPDDLADFIDYIATELFISLPAEVQGITFAHTKNNASLAARYGEPMPQGTMSDLLGTVPASIVDSLSTYSLLPTPDHLPNFLSPIFEAYIAAATAPPPPHNPTVRASACEICERDWIPLTYHHLIPRQMHTRALKRSWHEEWQLDSVAWLCRACHSYVHRIAGNEELAREWWSIERLMSREDVKAFGAWVGRVRWKAR